LHRETGRQGFGGWQQRQYDLQGRLVRQYSNQPVLAWQWEYDPDGLLIGSEQAGQAWRYHYDAQQRLVGWRKPDQAADWAFDPAGNRLPAPLPPLPPKPHRDWASQVRANLDNHDFDLLAPDFDPHPSARPPIDCWPGNRIDFDGAIDYRYDAHGNLVERYDHAGPCRLHLGYDGLHQL
ncbi:RHS repeat domain-containing protein, partial [Parachitinimonas caeni]